MSTIEQRIRHDLEPVLASADPGAGLSTYHDMPCALFVYDPNDEFHLRTQLTLLGTRLSQMGKRVTRISLAECLSEAIVSQRPLDQWFAAERALGTETVADTMTEVLAEYSPLVHHVAARMPADLGPARDVVFIFRAGALFPFYRTSALLEQLKGSLHAPTVLFYPGHLDGGTGLCFMSELEPEHNYRLKAF